MITFQEVLNFIEPISVSGSPPERMGKLCQDSREVRKGDLFIAVKGVTSDGHNFIWEAVERGASVVIAETEDPLNEVCRIVVDNTRELLGPLAQFFAGNPAGKMTVVGITGTNGKTTVATLVWQILTAMNKKASLLGTVEKRILTESYPSQLTTADPIELAEDMRQMAEAGSRYVVMEVSSHALHQKRVKGIEFDVAAFTNLSHDHLDYHESMNDYAESKRKLFNQLTDRSWAITNADDARGLWMVNSTPANVLSFSFHGKGLINASMISSSPEGNHIKVDETDLFSPLAGRFNAYNVTEALLICTALGLDGAEVAKILAGCKGAPGRMERVDVSISDKDNGPQVFVDYAHTPDALDNVSSTLKEISKQGQKLTIVFGCGGDRDPSKRPQMAGIAEKYGDKIYVTTDNPRTEKPQDIIDQILTGFSDLSTVQSIVSREEAIERAISEAGPDEIVLIAGKGHETYQEVHGLRSHFDDREVARRALLHKRKNGEVL